MKKLIKAVTAISNTLSNTVYSSIAWSGAMRFANGFGLPNNFVKDEVLLQLASLSTLVTVSDLQPTSALVLELALTAPEKEKADPAVVKLLIASGESQESIDKTLSEDHNMAMARFKKQETRINANKTEITALLDAAFSVQVAGKIGAMTERLETDLTTKILAKVSARRARILVDIASGKAHESDAKELGAINKLLKNEALAA